MGRSGGQNRPWVVCNVPLRVDQASYNGSQCLSIWDAFRSQATRRESYPS